MSVFLIVIVYVAFISLGLPDALLGGSWPIMRHDFGATTDMAGIISFVICTGTVISSLISSRVIHKLGTGRTTAFSVLSTAAALLGFAVSKNFIFLVICAIPLGIGAGAVDAALNNFVALHLDAKHMNWLHCFWGIGAMSSPLIASFFLTQNGNWRGGYTCVGLIQMCLVAMLFSTLFKWRKYDKVDTAPVEEGGREFVSNTQALKIRGAFFALFAFFCYCGMENSMGLWTASYFVEVKHVAPEIAASFGTFFFGGIAVGRLISGFLSTKINNKNLIRLGSGMAFAGFILFLLPVPYQISAAGLLIIGLGFAPIYPAIIHETPVRFGEKASQAMIGLEMACAYVGSTTVPPAIGFVCESFGMWLIPVICLVFCGAMIISSEILNRIVAKK